MTDDRARPGCAMVAVFFAGAVVALTIIVFGWVAVGWWLGIAGIAYVVARLSGGVT